MIGKCYVRSNDLTFDDLDEWQTDSYEFCDPFKDKDKESLCNSGISAGITDHDIIVGTPGSYTWRGGH